MNILWGISFKLYLEMWIRVLLFMIIILNINNYIGHNWFRLCQPDIRFWYLGSVSADKMEDFKIYFIIIFTNHIIRAEYSRDIDKILNPHSSRKSFLPKQQNLLLLQKTTTFFCTHLINWLKAVNSWVFRCFHHLNFLY